MKHPNLLDAAGLDLDGGAIDAPPPSGIGLVIDNFAGGGGASAGIEAAIGRAIDVAINHDPEAVRMHKANHPGTRHYCQSVWKADPQAVVAELGGGPVGLAWFSPDCKHFSKAKGGKPVEKNIRDLAWVVVLWAQRVRPRVIMLENVEEFKTWGPLLEDGKPCPVNRGLEYRRWLKELRKAGYRIEDRELRACDYGAPTSRKRLFVIARSDGAPIAWPAPSHGAPDSEGVQSGRLKPWRTAAEIIDFTIPCPSIFERKKDLADATHRRIAHGIVRYVLQRRPFIVPITHAGGPGRCHSGDDPVRTITTANRGELALVAPVLTPYYGDKAGQARACNPADEPLRTQPTENRFGLITATIVGCGGRRGQSPPVDVAGPYPTTTAKADACLVAANLLRFGNGSNDKSPGVPMPTITTAGGSAGGQFALVAATLISVDNTSTRACRAFQPEDPLRTITSAGGGYAAIAATLIQTSYGERQGQAPRVLDLHIPLGTIVAGGVKHSLATALLVPHVMTMRNAAKPFSAGDDPTHTITAGGAHLNLVTAFMMKYRANSVGTDLRDPASTVTANSYIKRPGGAPPLALVCAHMEQANTGVIGHSLAEPCSTIVQKGCTQRLVTSTIVKLKGTCRDGQPSDVPLHTVVAGGWHFAAVAAFLIKYYSAAQHGQPVDRPLDAVTSQARFGLIMVTLADGQQAVSVEIDGETFVIADIGMRMLTPRELARAQGFPDDYILDPVVRGKPLTKTAQIRMIGNSVCPPLAEALVRANFGLVQAEPEAAAA